MGDCKSLPPTDTPPTASIATSLIPWRKDDNRAKYLGYLACGFNVEESLYMLGLKLEWLDEQREDEDFSSFELRVPEIRKELSKEYIELDFFRNFRMVLEKDYRVLKRALEIHTDGDTPDVMTTQDHQYLLKMRSAYTPQQLQILEQVMHGVGGDNFNFALWVSQNQDVIEISRVDTVKMRGRLNSGKTSSDR